MVFVVPGGESPSQDHVVELPNLTYDLLNRWLKPSDASRGWFETYAASQTGLEADARAAWDSLITAVTGALWQELMGPVSDKLVALGLDVGAPVMLTAPGILSVLPLHAAWRETNVGPRPFNADWAVSYSPSAGVLAAIDRRSTARPASRASLLMIADPEDNLPFALLESDAIQQIWQSPSTRLGCTSASRTAVLSSTATSTHLHFACHGVFERHEPRSSALLLSGGERLTVEDVLLEMNLTKAELVVLSACETGIIDVDVAPSEFVGFPNAFLEAGANCVVSSLWAVDDASTALIMKRFYELLLREGLSAAEALRQSTEWVRTSTSRELELAEWWQAAGRATDDPEALTNSARAQQYPDEVPYASPEFCAAFYVSGRF
jgi:CHAT domain-containing protein